MNESDLAPLSEAEEGLNCCQSSRVSVQGSNG
jgi:hypothetical protein